MRFWEISKGLSDAEEGFKKGTLKENEFLLEFAEAVRQYNGESGRHSATPMNASTGSIKRSIASKPRSHPRHASEL
jgi:hypothetical protein